MKKTSRILKNGSPAAASPQSKTTQSRAKVRRETGSPLIAFFPKGEEVGLAEELVDLTKAEYAALKQAAAPSGSGVTMFMANAALEKARRLGAVVVGRRYDCLCMYQCGQFAGEIPLVEKLLPSATDAACQTDMTVDQFIADAIKEKLGKAAASVPQAVRTNGQSHPMDAHGRLEHAVYKAVALLGMITGEYVKLDASEPESVEGSIGAGIVELAHDAASELNLAFNEAWKECWAATQAAASNHQRRAA